MVIWSEKAAYSVIPALWHSGKGDSMTPWTSGFKSPSSLPALFQHWSCLKGSCVHPRHQDGLCCMTTSGPTKSEQNKESKWVSTICSASARQSVLCPSCLQWQPPSLRTPNKPNMPSHSRNSALYYYLKVNTFINRPLTRVVDNLRALLCKQ